MNAHFHNCPSSDDLKRFVTGRFNVTATEQLASHIEACPNCQTRIEQLDDTDASVDVAVGEANTIAFTEESHCGRVLEAIASGTKSALPPDQPQQLGDYTLLEPIGQGGMGMVYRARHAELGTLTAVKILQPHQSTDQATINRFEREMVAIGKLDHPNIVRALYAGEDAGQHYLVMEYVDGFDFSRISNAIGPLSVAGAAEVVRQAATGLSYVHRHGRVHRDIKPANLILAHDGTVKLMDLGLARVEEYPVEDTMADVDDILGSSAIDLTRTHQVMGTPEYMSPERVTDSSHVDHRADIYSLGCTFYKLLTGQSPMASSGSVTAFQQLVQRVQSPTISVRVKRSDVHSALSDLIDRMLAKSPADRPQSAEEIAALLVPFASGSNLSELAARTQKNLAPANSHALSLDDLSTANDGDSTNIDTTPGEAKLKASSKRALSVAAALLVLVATAMFFWQSYFANGIVIVLTGYHDIAELLASGNARFVDGTREVPIRLGETKLPVGHYEISTNADSRLGFSQDVIDIERGEQFVLTVTISGKDAAKELNIGQEKELEATNAPEPNEVLAIEQPSTYEPIDLISLIDPDRDIRANDWRLVDGAVVSNPDQPSMMMIPYQPPDHYRVELTATRLKYDESLSLGLVAGDQAILLAIDAYPALGFLSGIYQVEGVKLGKRSPPSHQGQLLPLGQPVPIAATLRRDDQRLSIDMMVGGSRVLSWRGNASQATGRGAYPLTQSGFLFLANWTASIKVSDFQVVPLDGEGTVVSFTDPSTNPQRAAVERVLWHGGAVSIVDHAFTPARTPPTVVGGFELIRSFEGHTGSVKTVAVSPDGKLAASGSGWPNGDRTIRIWNVETGEQLHSLDYGAHVLSVAFSADGQRVVAGGGSPRLSLWDVHSGELLRSYTAGDAKNFEQVGFTPDGTAIIVTTGRRGVVYALDTETGNILRRWDVGSSALCFAISPDSRQLAIGLDDTTVRVVNLTSGETVQELEGPSLDLSGRFDKETYSVDIAPDGKQIGAAYKANAIRLWDLSSGRVVKDIRSPVYSTKKIQFAGDGQRMFVAGWDGITAILDTATGKVLGTTPLIQGHSWTFALLPDGQRVLTGGGAKYENGFQPTGDYALRLWKMNIADRETTEQPSAPQLPTIRIDRWDQIPATPQVTAIDAQQSSWFDDRDLPPLANLPELASLDLSSTRVSATGLEQLGVLPNLKSLSLAETLLRDVPLELAESCPALKSLDLQSTLISDSSVAALNGFTHITELDLGGTRLTQDGLSQLNALSELESLSLAGTTIRQLDQLTSAGFPSLKRLDLLGTPTSNDELDALRERMPELEVISGRDPGDLIALIDVQRDADTRFSQGRVWQQEDGRLITIEQSRITLPIVLPAEFDLHMTASRIAEGNAPIIGFTRPGGRYFAVGFDHDRELGYYTILHGIDGKVDQQSPVKVQGESFPLGAEEPIEIEIRVRNRDKIADIQVLRNGTEVLRWQGDEARLHQLYSFWKGPNPTQAWMAQLTGSVGIEKLTVDPVSGLLNAGLAEQVSRFADLPVLNLDFRNREIDDIQLKELLKDRVPTHLTLYGPGITDASIDVIAANRQLRLLSLHSTGISESAIAQLADMPYLEGIEFWEMTQITDEVTKYLVTLPSLNNVLFKNCSFCAPGLERLHGRPITGVGLDNPGVNSEVLERYVLPFKKLRMLDLAGSPIDDDAMTLFPRFADLTLLHLGWNQTWQGPGLENLKQIPSLRQLYLDSSAVKDRSLGHLAGTTQIRGLSLRKTALGDDSIETLVTLTGLEWLNLTETNFTAAGVERLKALMPHVDIKFDGGAEK